MPETRLADLRSMTTREEVGKASAQWLGHCRKIDTLAENYLRQLHVNTAGRTCGT